MCKPFFKTQKDTILEGINRLLSLLHFKKHYGGELLSKLQISRGGGETTEKQRGILNKCHKKIGV